MPRDPDPHFANTKLEVLDWGQLEWFPLGLLAEDFVGPI